jgi:alpha-N-acetylglucosamine transferase
MIAIFCLMLFYIIDSKSKYRKTKEKPPNQQYAYVFYSTSDDYFCSAIVNIYRLLKLNMNNHIDIIILHTNDIEVKEYLFLADNRIKLFKIVPWTKSNFNAYYTEVFNKLAIFNLTQYERIIYMDSDSIIINNIDRLFYIDDQIEFAAPPDYWDETAPPGVFTSAMMIIKPSEKRFKQLKELSIEFSEKLYKGRQMYDMDLLNLAFVNQTTIMPGIFCLNHHWSRNIIKKIFGEFQT